MKLRPVQYLGYGGGEAANNLSFSLVSAFLLIYYTDVAGISARPPARFSWLCGCGVVSRI
jgi:Na+/melibiose symporter-like transporter